LLLKTRESSRKEPMQKGGREGQSGHASHHKNKGSNKRMKQGAVSLLSSDEPSFPQMDGRNERTWKSY